MPATVRGKILEGENFGGEKFWQINGSKVLGKEKFGKSVGSLLKILAFVNIGGKNFGKLPTVCQIHQNFSPPKFSHVRYLYSSMLYKNILLQTDICVSDNL